MPSTYRYPLGQRTLQRNHGSRGFCRASVSDANHDLGRRFTETPYNFGNPCDARLNYKKVEAIDLNRQGGSGLPRHSAAKAGEPPLPKTIDQKKAPGGFVLPALVSLAAELSPALLRAGRKVDEVAILQGDAVLVGGVLLQVGGGHVEYPEATAPAERTVRDIVVSSFIYVVNRAPHRVNQGYRAVAARKHRIWVGDRLAIGAANRELHWNSAADLTDAAAVLVDWGQNHAARGRPSGGAIADRERARRIGDVVISRRTGRNEYRRARRDCIRSRQGTRRIPSAVQRDRGDRVAEVEGATDREVNGRRSCVRRVGTAKDLTAVGSRDRQRRRVDGEVRSCKQNVVIG